jgi:hypothetical protein
MTRWENEMQSFLVTEIGDIHVDNGGEFVGLSFNSKRGGPVKLGLHPDMANDLASLILKALADSTNSGKLPLRNQTIDDGMIHGEATPSGILLRFDLDGVPGRGVAWGVRWSP